MLTRKMKYFVHLMCNENGMERWLILAKVENVKPRDQPLARWFDSIQENGLKFTNMQPLSHIRGNWLDNPCYNHDHGTPLG